MPWDPTRCINQHKGCTGRWIERDVPVSADDVIQAMDPLCPDMTAEERAAQPLQTIKSVTQLTCPECGLTARRIQYQRIPA